MKLQQLSIFLENQPGRLVSICETLAQAGISIETLTLADTSQYGILRLLIKEWEKAREALQAAGQVVKSTEVVAIEVSDQPGGLAQVLRLVDDAGISVEYMYAFTIRKGENAVMIFRFDQLDKAIDTLKASGVNVLKGIELFD